MPAPDLTVTAAAECDGLCVEHRPGVGVVHALREVSATFATGRLTVVAGPSGSGKSTLLRVLAGLQLATAGRVAVGGVDLSRLRHRGRRQLRRRRIGVVLQNPADNLIEYLSAIDQVGLAARLRGTDPHEAEHLLDAVGLASRRDSRPAELSGGEQQRVAFAAAVAGAPAVLVADEPTAQLDARSADDLVARLQRLVDDGCTAIVGSHDDAVISAAHDVVWLHDGQVVAR
ncbi:MAG: ABC transporter ATP-binding protein [Acidimicrobiales bacterium]